MRKGPARLNMDENERVWVGRRILVRFTWLFRQIRGTSKVVILRVHINERLLQRAKILQAICMMVQPGEVRRGEPLEVLAHQYFVCDQPSHLFQAPDASVAGCSVQSSISRAVWKGDHARPFLMATQPRYTVHSICSCGTEQRTSSVFISRTQVSFKLVKDLQALHVGHSMSWCVSLHQTFNQPYPCARIEQLHLPCGFENPYSPHSRAAVVAALYTHKQMQYGGECRYPVGLLYRSSPT